MRVIGIATAALGLAVLLAACSGGSSFIQPSASRLAAATASPVTTPTVAKSFDPFRDEAETASRRREVIENPTIAQVMQKGALEEISMGRADAPVTIIKYASLTCPYCRKFQMETFPVLKREYIDTGKVRFIMREFPIGFQSGAATIALRCVPRQKYFSLYGKFLRQQGAWASQEVRREPIFRVARQVGLSRAAFDACYEDKALVANLNWVKNRGRTLGVIGTPNFFVNGKLMKQVLTMRDIRKLVSEVLAKPVALAHKS